MKKGAQRKREGREHWGGEKAHHSWGQLAWAKRQWGLVSNPNGVHFKTKKDLWATRIPHSGQPHRIEGIA
jgi:hypothetical protein